MYVCICTWVYFISFNSCLKVLFLREYFLSYAYREEISYLQHRTGMWSRLRGYCRRGPTLLTIGTGRSSNDVNVLVCIHLCFIRLYPLSRIVPIYLLPPISVAELLVAHIHPHIHCILIRYSIVHCMYGRVAVCVYSSRSSLAVSSASYSVSPPPGEGPWSPICQRT